MQDFWIILRTITARDALDILLVSAPFYVIFAILRGVRSFAVLWGIVSLLVLSFALYLTAKLGGLQATALVYERFWIILILVFLIIFQGEMKKALTDVGRMKLFRAFFAEETHSVGEIVKAAAEMASQKVGAIIAIERRNTLVPYLGTGTMLDAAISAEMLRSIFNHSSPLHDGAVIIRGERIVAAGCILPLTDNPRLSRDLGTRHRAAIGLSEEVDAIVVVVSEETGVISVAEEGQIERFLAPDDLQTVLERELDVRSEEEA